MSINTCRQHTLLASDMARNAEARKHMRKHFSAPLYLADLLQPAQRVLFEDAAGRVSLELELVETHVCAAAQFFIGNMHTPFAQAVCYERDGLRGKAAAEESGPMLMPCMDLYARTLKGISWF